MLLKRGFYRIILYVLFTFSLLGYTNIITAQSVGISSTAITPDASSILELRTTSKGILVPRMTSAQRDAISSPANGLIIYNTDLLKINYYDGTVWRILYLGTNSLSGTTNRISVSGTGTDPVIDISSAYMGQSTITTLGTITTGTWNASTVPTSYGGTGTTSAPSLGGVIYGAGTTSYASTAGTATAGQILRSGASAAPSWSTATYPATAGTSGTLLSSNGTNIVNTTATYPATAGTSGTLLSSNGTNIVNTTATYPATAGTSGTLLSSNGTNIVNTTATYPATAGTSGTLLSSNGTNIVNTTATYPATAGTSGTLLSSNGTNIVNTTATYPSTGGTAGTVLTSNGTNFIASAAGSAGQVLRSSGSGTPAWSTATYPAISNNAGAILSSDGTNFIAGALSNSSNAISSDIVLSTSTYTDGPSVTLAAGTWYVSGTITGASSSINTYLGLAVRLWDGTTSFASGESYNARGGGSVVTYNTITLSAIITLTSSKTIRISALDASGNAGLMKAALAVNGVGNNASFINAFRIGN